MNTKFLLINQHSSNHGDEAAGKALVSKLNLKDGEMSMLYNTVNKEAIMDFGVQFNKILLTHSINLLEKLLILLTFLLPVQIISLFFIKSIKKEYLMIKSSDTIISMPGGANMGLYSDWRYVWRIYLAEKLNKKVAIYSVSIGPFKNNFFKKVTTKVLRKVNFLSLRDAQSHRIADELNIKYVKSIDTAFLTQPIINNFNLANYNIPFDENNYVVMVPNNLTAGHLSFRNYDSLKMKSIYVEILQKLLRSNNNVVFLPQLFANGDDKSYFIEIIREVKTGGYEDRIVVVDENTSSDIQQNIVRNSKFTIGARYHSIIFSINNNRPFLCLSYENKMKNTLELLGYDEYGVDLTLLPDGYDIKLLKNEINDILDKLLTNKIEKISNIKPHSIANNCFQILKSQFLTK